MMLHPQTEEHIVNMTLHPKIVVSCSFMSVTVTLSEKVGEY